MDEPTIISMVETQFDIHGLTEWTFRIVDDLDGNWGYTHSDTKHIEIARDFLPTKDRNVKELVLHEVAHALCGHGRHDLEWWDKLMSIGGCGVWVFDDGKVMQAKIID